MNKILTLSMLLIASSVMAQNVAWYETTQTTQWQTKKAKMASKADSPVVLDVTGSETGRQFVAWGTTFNELDWKAFSSLSSTDQEEIMHNLFAPDGDLRFTRGRISMNANDYALGWYQCDSVEGDFSLRYFNIDRDKTTILPLIHRAQRYNDHMTFWVSPWSPPAWMKINQDYPVQSSPYNTQPKEKDYMLFDAVPFGNDPEQVRLMGDRNGVFPRRLATTDYFIQDPRYLQCYADMFCRFIDLYAAEGVKIDMVMYQNEAYTYAVYPGCAWTAEGTVRFNTQYLAPTLQKRHPEVRLYLGTFNTNRQDYIEKILSSDLLRSQIKGFGEQWECREIVQNLMKKYPELHYIMTESECGNGSMDWNAGEHTFFLLSDNTGKGIEEYFNWNFILLDQGTSAWGWNQNALIQVDSKTNRFRYTPEYYAYKHFSHFVSPGSVMVGYSPRERGNNSMAVVFRTPDQKYVAICGNFNDTEKRISVKLGKKYLNITLSPHSFNTFVV